MSLSLDCKLSTQWEEFGLDFMLKMDQKGSICTLGTYDFIYCQSQTSPTPPLKAQESQCRQTITRLIPPHPPAH